MSFFAVDQDFKDTVPVDTSDELSIVSAHRQIRIEGMTARSPFSHIPFDGLCPCLNNPMINRLNGLSNRVLVQIEHIKKLLTMCSASAVISTLSFILI